MEDNFLIQQSLSGNKNAFKLLVIRYQRPVFSFLQGLGDNKQNHEDLAQETFLKAYKHLKSFDPEKGTFASWLFTIAKNNAYNHSKKKKEVTEENYLLEEKLASDSSSPEQLYQSKENKTTISKLIKLLPSPFKSAVMLSYLEELSLSEIAEIEKCSLGTIKSRIHRGKTLLRKMLYSEEQYEY